MLTDVSRKFVFGKGLGTHITFGFVRVRSFLEIVYLVTVLYLS